ncbi:MAG: hypothetical protein V4714_16960 [Bacteroidota bacterium]
MGNGGFERFVKELKQQAASKIGFFFSRGFIPLVLKPDTSESRRKEGVPIAPTKAVVLLLVYVCQSATVHAYPRTDTCEGLAYCTHRVNAVTELKAQQHYKRTPCRRCYK